MSTAAAPAAAPAPAPAKLSYVPTPFFDLANCSDLKVVTSAIETQHQKLAALKQAIEDNEQILNRNQEHQSALETAKKNADEKAKHELEAKEAKRLKREADEKAKEAKRLKRESEEKAKKEEDEKERKKAKILNGIERYQAALAALETPSTAAPSMVPSPSLSESGKSTTRENLCGHCKKPVKDHTTEERRACLKKRKEEIEEQKQVKEAKKAKKPMQVDETKGIQKPKHKSPRPALAIKVPKKKIVDNNAARLIELHEEGSSMPRPLLGPGKGKGPGGLKAAGDSDVTTLVSDSSSGLSSGSSSGSESDSDDNE